jgi:NTE family protein
MQSFTQCAEVRNLLRDLKEACERKQFSDIVDGEGRQYVDLVMGGGGTLGIALTGYTYAVEQAGLRFLRIGGTSAGSINALLMAALGPADQPRTEPVIKVLSSLSLESLIEPRSIGHALIRMARTRRRGVKLGFVAWSAWQKIKAELGVESGDPLERWLQRTLAEHNVYTTADVNERMRRLPASIRRRDGGELAPDQKSPYLAIVACDVSTETKVEFPRMASLYWDKPDEVHPATFVRASAGVPFFFQPFRVSGVPQGEAAWRRWQDLATYEEDIPEQCLFVDGGIMSNFPIQLFHSSAPPAIPTFGVKLGTGVRKRHRIGNPLQLAQAVLDSARHCLDYEFLTQNPDYRRLVTCIDTGGHYWLNFGMSDDARQDLFLRGMRAACHFLIRFDWLKYKDLRSQRLLNIADAAR